MDTNRLIVGQERSGTRSGSADTEAAFKVLGVFGLLFLFASSIDIVLALLPADLSVPEVRFTALGATAGALPLTAVGVLAFEIAALGLASRAATSVAAGIGLLFTALSLVALSLLVVSHGPTRAAASNELLDLVSATFRRGIASYLFFGTAFVLGGGIAWGSLRRWNS